MGIEEEIDAIQEEIASTPYNKATEAHIGRLKAKLAEKKEDLESRGSAGGGQGYAVEKHGDATVTMVGFPSVGKSTLLNTLTNAESEVGSYAFTTLEVKPGMLAYRGANIQILDVPGLIEGAAEGRGRGREVLSVVRTADLLLFVLSPFEIEQYAHLREELYENKVRLDAEPPDVRVSKRDRGGIQITASVDPGLEEGTIKDILREHGYVNAVVTIREELTVDRFIDAIMDNRVYLPSLVMVNKADLIDPSYADTVLADLEKHGLSREEVIFVSATEDRGVEHLKEALWDRLELVRIYMDKPGRGIDWEEPLILPAGSTVADAIEKLGGDFADRFRFARVSGPSATHDEQRVGTGHVLADEDVLRLLLRR